MNRYCFVVLITLVGVSSQSLSADAFTKQQSNTETARALLDVSGFDGYHKSAMNLPSTGFPRWTQCSM